MVLNSDGLVGCLGTAKALQIGGVAWERMYPSS